MSFDSLPWTMVLQEGPATKQDSCVAIKCNNGNCPTATQYGFEN